MSQIQLTDMATFLLRVALGIMFLAHSVILKLFVFTLPGTAQFFESVGMPGWLAYVVFTAEVVAGVFLILGVQTRWVALATVPILAGATWAHSGNGWMFGYQNGGWEYPAGSPTTIAEVGPVGSGLYRVVQTGRSLTAPSAPASC